MTSHIDIDNEISVNQGRSMLGSSSKVGLLLSACFSVSVYAHTASAQAVTVDVAVDLPIEQSDKCASGIHGAGSIDDGYTTAPTPNNAADGVYTRIPPDGFALKIELVYKQFRKLKPTQGLKTARDYEIAKEILALSQAVYDEGLRRYKSSMAQKPYKNLCKFHIMVQLPQTYYVILSPNPVSLWTIPSQSSIDLDLAPWATVSSVSDFNKIAKRYADLFAQASAVIAASERLYANSLP